MSKKNENKKEKVIETLSNSCSESVDCSINEILNEDTDASKKLSQDEEFKMTMEEIANRDVNEFIDTAVEEIENVLTYKFASNAHIKLSNNCLLDTGIEEKYQKIIQLKTSNNLLIDGTFTARELRVGNHPDSINIGKIVFNDKQKVDTLLIGNAGVCGTFDAISVFIKNNACVDISLDISNKTKCAYLLIDMRFNKVCGKIRLTEGFFNQMSELNKKFILSLSKNEQVKITVEDTPFEKFRIPLNRIADFTYDEMLRDLKMDR